MDNPKNNAKLVLKKAKNKKSLLQKNYLFTEILIPFHYRDMHTISNVYIFNLAVADLLFLAGTPILIVQSLQQSWTFGAAVCKIYIIGNGVSYSSILKLNFIAN